ncbi:unnamed protein product [Ilex paraguariensis]|uniref:Uncharacterized protein n=1 Tax=Ilex paraguariensis TaxID=185542 RepID=A0ABC8UCM8_9AQUA
MSRNLPFVDSYVGYTSEPSAAEKSSDDEQRKVPALPRFLRVVMEVMARQKLLRFIEPIGQLSVR